MTAADWPVCLQCARPARQDLGPALSTGYRVILCAWDDSQGYPRGHGKTLGTYNAAEALDLVERRRIARLEREHPTHRTARGVHRDCPRCKARGPHLDHLLAGRTEPGCADCERARRRVGSAHVGP